MRRVNLAPSLLALSGCHTNDTLNAAAYLMFELWPCTLCVVMAIGVPVAAIADTLLRRRVGYKA